MNITSVTSLLRMIWFAKTGVLAIEAGTIAVNCFRKNQIPFQDMQPADELVRNADNDNSRYCLAKPRQIYLPIGGNSELDLSTQDGTYSVQWFNPRAGGSLVSGPVQPVAGGNRVDIGEAPDEQDWLAVIRRQ